MGAGGWFRREAQENEWWLISKNRATQDKNKTNNKVKLGLKIFFSLSHDHNNLKPSSLLQLEINTNIHDPKCYPPPGNQKTGCASNINLNEVKNKIKSRE